MPISSAKLNTNLLLPQALAASLEALINKVLALESANTSFEQLANKTLTLVLAELGFGLSFTVLERVTADKQTLMVTSLTEHADCTITTSLSTLRELKAEQQLTDLIKQDRLAVSGDIKVAQQFAHIAQHLAIDWQSELAHHIGDIPTHKLVQLAKNISAKVGFAATQIQADASEYIVHEQRLVITKSQIELFNHQVSEVNQQVTDLDVRVNRLFQSSKRPVN